MRPFLDVMGEIYNLRQNKIIDDTQFSRLTLALGGGTRRQAAYSSFIENFDRVSEVADESARASGDAEEALASQLATVQTALDRLGNAFSSLAQTMGSEGGFLGILTASVNLMTDLVETFDGLIGVLGKATPALAAFIATSLLLKSRGAGSIQGALGDLGQNIVAGSSSAGFSSYAKPLVETRQDRFREGVATNLLGTNTKSAIAQGIGVSLIPALQNFFNKDDRFGKTKAGADVLGGIGGAIVGTLTGAGPIVGAAIGTSIAEVFVNATIARKTDIFGYGKETALGETFNKPLSDNLDEALEQAE